MNNRDKKILIIGLGSIGARHLRNLLKLGYENLAVGDPNSESVKNTPETVNLPYYKNPKTAFIKEKPQIVFICAPTNLHIKLASMAIDYGTDVFIEKPLSHSLGGIDALIKKAKSRKKIVMVACNFRFDKGFFALKKTVDSGRFGKPIFARMAGGYFLPSARKNTDYKKIYAAQKQGGGVWLDSGSHIVNYLMALFGDVKKVIAAKNRLHSLGIKAEETIQAILEHKNGILSSVSLDYVSRSSIHRVEVVTEKGTITWNFKEDFVIFENENKKTNIYRGKKDVNRMFIDELLHFFACVEKRKPALQDLGEGKKILSVLLEAK